MRVLVRGGQFNGQARFDTWLFTIARNLVIDQRRKRTMSSTDEIFESNSDDDRGRSFEAADDDPTPFDRLSNLEDRRADSCGTHANRYAAPGSAGVCDSMRICRSMEIAKVTRAPLSTVKSGTLPWTGRPEAEFEKSAWRRLEAM